MLDSVFILKNAAFGSTFVLLLKGNKSSVSFQVQKNTHHEGTFISETLNKLWMTRLA